MEWPDSWPTQPTKETRLSARRSGWPPKSSNSRLMTPRYCSCGIPVKWEGGGGGCIGSWLFPYLFINLWQVRGDINLWVRLAIEIHEYLSPMKKRMIRQYFLMMFFSCTRCMNSVMIFLVVILTLMMMFFRLTSGV